jgi:hypothetical protein
MTYSHPARGTGGRVLIPADSGNACAVRAEVEVHRSGEREGRSRGRGEVASLGICATREEDETPSEVSGIPSAFRRSQIACRVIPRSRMWTIRIASVAGIDAGRPSFTPCAFFT